MLCSDEDIPKQPKHDSRNRSSNDFSLIMEQDILAYKVNLEERYSTERKKKCKVKAEDSKKRLEEWVSPTQQKYNVCTNKNYVDEADLDDLTVFEDDLRLKYFHRQDIDQEMDRLIEMMPAYTGMFRDCVRRIDYVLVLAATGDDLYADELKVAFLTNLIKMGLELEIEPGVMKYHNNLLFVKIHALDWALEKHSSHFEVEKFFTENHSHFIGPKTRPVESMLKFFDFFRPRFEREWVKMIRKRYFRPLNLSNRDRSYITFMMIKHQPFGLTDGYGKEKYYGFHRLVQSKLILDGYALHDGPYFLTDEQVVANANARQILYHHWAGCRNMFSSQPINLIQEYFGPKIGLFFAFYQFYIWMLLLQIPISILMALLKYKHLLRIFKMPRDNIYCDNTTQEVKLCPQCQNFKACPLRNLADYCEVHAMVGFFKKTLTLSSLFTFWVIFFYFFWRKKQSYWRWMWELNHHPRHSIIRPEYELFYGDRVKNSRFRRYRIRPIIMKLLVWLIEPILALICISIAVGTLVGAYVLTNYIIEHKEQFPMKNITENELLLKFRDYLFISMMLPIQIIILLIAQKVFLFIAPYLTRAENHRLFDNFEKSFAYRIFAYSLVLNIPVLVFVAWIKGRFFLHPLYHWNEKLTIKFMGYSGTYNVSWFGEFLYYNCNKTRNCLDETGFILVLTILFNLIITFVVAALKTLPFITSTDYNSKKERKKSAPEWEREYSLKKLSEEDVAKWFNVLMIQLTIFAWFGNIIPLMSIVLFFANLIYVRKMAGCLIKYYRRPMIFNVRGIGPWNVILAVICFSVPVTNSFLTSRANNIFWTNTFETKDFSIVPEAKEAFEKLKNDTKETTDKCFYETKFRKYDSSAEPWLPWPYNWFNFTDNATKLVVSYNRYVVEVNQITEIFKYSHLFLIVITLLFYYFPKKSRNVIMRYQTEQNLRRLGAEEHKYVNYDNDEQDVIRV